MTNLTTSVLDSAHFRHSGTLSYPSLHRCGSILVAETGCVGCSAAMRTGLGLVSAARAYFANAV